MFFKKVECLISTYKSSDLSGKLPKMKKCIYIYIYIRVYFILSINFLLIIIIIMNDSLNKIFCKKAFRFNISFFKKCYIYDIFTINFHNIVNWSYSNIFYSFNIFIGSPPHPTQPISRLFCFFFFFLPFFLSHKSQTFTFCLLSFSFFLLSSTHLATQPTTTRANPSPFVFFLFLFLYFPPHIQPHSPRPHTSSPWSSLFFSFSLNSTTHNPHPRTSSPWSSHVISLNFTKNLQYLSLSLRNPKTKWELKSNWFIKAPPHYSTSTLLEDSNRVVESETGSGGFGIL